MAEEIPRLDSGIYLDSRMEVKEQISINLCQIIAQQSRIVSCPRGVDGGSGAGVLFADEVGAMLGLIGHALDVAGDH